MSNRAKQAFVPRMMGVEVELGGPDFQATSYATPIVPNGYWGAVEGNFWSAALPNGSRRYIDARHAETASAEAPGALSAFYSMQADRVNAASLNVVFSNKNVDSFAGAGLTSFGVHYNYLVSRKLWNEITYERGRSLEQSLWCCWQVVKTLIAGAGHYNQKGMYYLSGRALALQRLFCYDTNNERPLINLRDSAEDEGLSIKSDLRLHDVSNDGGTLYAAEYWKLFSSDLVLRALEDGCFANFPYNYNPDSAINDLHKLANFDLKLEGVYPAASALDVLEAFYQRLHDAYCSRMTFAERQGMGLWKFALENLSQLESDFAAPQKNPDALWKLGQVSDWARKLWAIEVLFKDELDKNNLEAHKASLDLAYHSYDSESALLTEEERRGLTKSFIDPNKIEWYRFNAPPGSRAQIRAYAVQTALANASLARGLEVDWGRIIFPARRILPIEDPYQSNLDARVPEMSQKDTYRSVIEKQLGPHPSRQKKSVPKVSFLKC